MASREIVRYKSPARTAFSVLVILFLIIFFVWTVLPLAIMLTSSFKDLLDAFKLPAEGDWGGVGVMFDFKPTGAHYVELFTEKHFGEYMRNSLIASLGSAVVSVFLGSMAAYALSRAEFRGKKDLLFWIISTRMAPVVAVMVPLYVIFRSSGLVGTLPGLILAYTTFNLPFAIWILKGFFDNVPYAIEEAALCDGANRWQALRMIMPLVAPGVGAFIVLCVLFGWNDFLFASIIGSGGAKTLPVATAELVQPVKIQWGSIMAAGVVTTVPMMFLGLLIRRYLVTGLTMGAVRE
ncbi:MAG: carbohydrate ABC transporter permease [Rhodospirillaceae bacterium]|jgi:multiple sugar transport system permease protein|nr:carbohydrate ABC transporter permease [Rhodospirillaceae bacterium]MBT3927936.1 carbohydrate ABC transporter permease [Rhodospirillaceae bacterium]MBT5040432.1 carbohydrate ABC transporter permease [Rhodospirillaceae bacterium]MBT5677662.1 carbohydrate ABC transporter permease [Rhodospirillaceae bacterium]MBT5780260.1 carbohydrate ABC transporter permease [Rhodospirillaceae bacterium]